MTSEVKQAFELTFFNSVAPSHFRSSNQRQCPASDRNSPICPAQPPELCPARTRCVQQIISAAGRLSHTQGQSVLESSQFNKGSAFSNEEKSELGLHGLLPPNIQTLDEQVQRAYQQYSSRADDLAKNTFLSSMKAQNHVLYYKVCNHLFQTFDFQLTSPQLVQTHLKEMFSVIYTPTEGDAIQNYSRLFRKPEGCFLNIEDQDRIEESLSAFGTVDEVDYIVVSDGEEILGIGDQGVGAILISVAKLVITTLCAGIHPSRQLPVVLDCGTDVCGSEPGRNLLTSIERRTSQR